MPPTRRALLAAVLPTIAAGATMTSASAAGAAAGRHAPRQIGYTQWDSTKRFHTGTADGVRVAHGRVHFDRAAGTRRHGGHDYDAASWTSPWVTPGMTFTELIASWAAATPGDSYLEVRVRGRAAGGATSTWDVLGRWAAGDAHVHRDTVDGQDDDLASVSTDTWRTSGLVAYQLQVTLLRRAGTDAAPSFDTVGAVASRVPARGTPTSRPGRARGVVLDVPRYSQMVHQGEYPQYDGGGEAWCSPTSTSMVLGFYDALPAPAAYAWVRPGTTDPWVDHAARMTYDYAYEGTGNWPFNTAYAAGLAGHAFVTRLRSLREAEEFVAAGIPLVASITFGEGDLDGAPIGATRGHLVVIAGFTEDGDVVVNDPAASTREGVRRTYDRAQLEDAWLQGSGGMVYVIHDDAHPLPGGEHTNW